MATTTDRESIKLLSGGLLFLFFVLVVENGDSRAKLLGIVGADDTCWDDFTFLLGLCIFRLQHFSIRE